MPRTAKRPRTVAALRSEIRKTTTFDRETTIALAAVLTQYAGAHEEPEHVKRLRLAAQRYLDVEASTSGAVSADGDLVGSILEKFRKPIELAPNEEFLLTFLEAYVASGPWGSEGLVDLVTPLYYRMLRRKDGNVPLLRRMSVAVERGMCLGGKGDTEGLTERNLLHLLATRTVEASGVTQAEAVALLAPVLEPLGLFSERMAPENSETLKKLKVLFERYVDEMPALMPSEVRRAYYEIGDRTPGTLLVSFTGK